MHSYGLMAWKGRDTMSSNLHPVDEIQKIREQIKALKAREAELKAMIVSGEAPKEGQFVRARLITRKSKRFNCQAAEAELGSIDRFLVETEATILKLEIIEDDGFNLVE
jgi:cob(I)alamin adenosyltransferase